MAIALVDDIEYNRLYIIVDDKLSTIIRSSSVVENINSQLRKYFNKSRDQVNQNRLNLIRFYLNYRVFERGKRKGKSPAELFLGRDYHYDNWLDAFRNIRASN